MPRVTRANLPAEIVLYIAENFFELERDIFFHRSSKDRTREKSGLLAPSLVCRHWAAAIRPVLFRYLILRSADDVRALKAIVAAPTFAAGGLAVAVKQVDVLCLTSDPRCFLPLLHGLAPPLRRAIFHCHVHTARPAPSTHARLSAHASDAPTADIPPKDAESSSGAEAHAEKHWAPFAAVPGVPPTYVKLTLLTLVGVHFADARALARLADAFASLFALSCDELVFDAPPAVPAALAPVAPGHAQQGQHARHVRRGPRTLWSVRISRCAGLDLADHVRLAAYILNADTRLGLDAGAWAALLDALSALAPRQWQQVEVALRQRDGRRAGLASLGFSPEFTVKEDAIIANVQVSPAAPSPSPSPSAPSSQVTGINLTTSFASYTPDALPSLDGLHALAPALQRLHLWTRPRDNAYHAPDTAGLKTVLRTVLAGDALAWALEGGTLQCLCGVKDDRPWPTGDAIGMKDIRAVHDVWEGEGGLCVDEKVEWLVRIAPEERARYLREVSERRAPLSFPIDQADQVKLVPSIAMA